MKKTWLEIDLIKLLDLDKILTSSEVDEITDNLTKEIWYRILNEELVKLLSKEELDKLRQQLKEKSLSTIIAHLTQNYPQIKITSLITIVTEVVKKEFVREYVKDIVGERKDKETLSQLDKILKVIEENTIDFIALKKSIRSLNSITP